jgi:hypothetical protein
LTENNSGAEDGPVFFALAVLALVTEQKNAAPMAVIADLKLHSCWIWLSRSKEGKALMVPHESPEAGQHSRPYPHNVFIAQRSNLNEPSKNLRLLQLAGVGDVGIRSPKFVRSTGELYLVAQPRRDRGKSTMKICVIRDVAPQGPQLEHRAPLSRIAHISLCVQNPVAEVIICTNDNFPASAEIKR